MSTRLQIAVFFFYVAEVYAQTNDQYPDKITGLRADVRYRCQKVFSTKSAIIGKFRFEPKLRPYTVVSFGKLAADRVYTSINVLIVESQNELPGLVLDLNAEFKITSNERFLFSAAPSTDRYLHLTLKLLITNKLFSDLPTFNQSCLQKNSAREVSKYSY